MTSVGQLLSVVRSCQTEGITIIAVCSAKLQFSVAFNKKTHAKS